jgi:hypothetical protein
MQRDALTFSEVVKRHGHPAAAGNPSRGKLARRPSRPGLLGPPSEDWQIAALLAVGKAAACLRDEPIAEQARRYLTEGRGLAWETIERAALGYNPAWLDIGGGCWLAPGVTIPAMIGGHLFYINVRTTQAARAAARKRVTAGKGGLTLGKYQAVAGSRLKALYGANGLLSARNVVICEGEFDTVLMCEQFVV